MTFPMTSPHIDVRQRIAFYGRRKGRPLTEHALSTMGTVLPELSVHRWLQPGQWPQHVWLDVGCGSGEHMIQWLEHHPRDCAIGAEVFLNGLAQCTAHLSEQDYPRCSLYPDPVQTLWPLLPPASLDGIWLLFADPWPKTRHHRRRLLQHSFLDQCSRVLKPGACLHVASDHPGLIAHSLSQLHTHPAWNHVDGADFDDLVLSRPWPAWPETWPTTRYYRKAVQQGIRCMWTSWRESGGGAPQGEARQS